MDHSLFNIEEIGMITQLRITLSSKSFRRKNF